MTSTGRKALLFIFVGIVIGVFLSIGGLFYLLRNPATIADLLVHHLPDSKDPLLVKERLARAEGELATSSTEYDRWVALTDLSMVEVDTGFEGKAKTHADEVLRLAPKYQQYWNYGNAVHKGNLTLGRLALRSGNLPMARSYLLAAGKTPGSPQLDSFGPNMILAKELLEHGEKDAVLQYFQSCGRFWEMGQDKLREWTALVKGDVPPDFGANLVYLASPNKSFERTAPAPPSVATLALRFTFIRSSHLFFRLSL